MSGSDVTAFASLADLTAYLGYDAPEGSERALQEATDLILGVEEVAWTRSRYRHWHGFYRDLLSDEEIAAALRKACCAQVEYWIVVNGSLVGAEFNVRRLHEDGMLDGKKIPAHKILAPKAEEVFRSCGLWSSSVVVF